MTEVNHCSELRIIYLSWIAADGRSWEADKLDPEENSSTILKARW